MRRNESMRRRWAVVSAEEVEQADRFFEEILGRSPAADAKEVEQAERFFEELLGDTRPSSSRAPRGARRSFAAGEGVASPPGRRRVSPVATIRWVQRTLPRVGETSLAVDGVLGPLTHGALQRFARAQGLRGNGRLVSSTLHGLAARSGTVPPEVWAGAAPSLHGRAPALAASCAEPPTVLDRFAFGLATPTAEHRVALAGLAQRIVASQGSDEPVYLVCISGHTDDVGGDGPNELLGQRRADAVQDELMVALERSSPGLAARLGWWSTSAGETEPVVPNTSADNRARNRRVEIKAARRWQAPDGAATVTISSEDGAVGEESLAVEQNPPAPHSIPVGRAIRLVATGSPLPVGTPAYTWVSADPGVASITRVGTPQVHPSRADIRGVTPGATTITVTYRTAAGGTSSASVQVVVPVPVIPVVDRYGCHDLKRGDMDRDPSQANRPRWGGQVGAAATICLPPPAVPPVGPQHVQQLQDDLRSLGFLIVGNPSGTFDRHTEWAVREFQAYAKMDLVARVRAGVAPNLRQGAHIVAAANGHDVASNLSEYVHSLDATGNTAPYAGPSSGVVDAATRAALDHWLRNDWRCPVVVEAWTMRAGARSAPAATNLWAHDSHPSSATRMFVRDFTNHYTFPATHNADDMHVIGDFVTYLQWSGPRSVPPSHTWAEGEIMPAALVGNAAPAGATLSTYRVVRAASEVECIGFFDSVNCYDNAFVSVGPCHWTLGIVSATGAFSEGEMCGYLAYLSHIDPVAFRQAMEVFGARVDESWVSAAGPADGADMFSAGQRKYTGWVALQQANGRFTRLPQTEADGNYFKTWHWHYRFVMAGRTIQGYRERMWDMARVRIRDIRSVPWGAGVAPVGAGAAARAATIGDVFTSERAVGMLLRWHIRFPSNVVNAGGPGVRLRDALARARAADPTLPWNADPSTWNDAQEGHLIAGIMAAAPAGVRATLTSVRDWPTWLAGPNPRGFTLAAPVAAPLEATRGSFAFDSAGLPPAPP